MNKTVPLCFSLSPRLNNLVAIQKRNFVSFAAATKMPGVDENYKNLMVRHKYWNGTPSWELDKFSIDCSKMNLAKYLLTHKDNTKSLDLDAPMIQELKDRILEIYKDQGAVYIRKTGFNQTADLKSVLDILQLNAGTYKGGANYREPIDDTPNVYEPGIPADQDLFMHHEMEYMNESCQWISFMCLQETNPPMKGATYISHSEKVTDEMMESELGQKLKERGTCYVRKLPDRKYFLDNPHISNKYVYNYWQDSMFTEDPDEAEEFAKSKGSEITWEDSKEFGR